ncbi:MAG: hypothetical protein J2P29_04255, partial [Actinobacteria bacterium]|nr:hypothetical protein [Actinomycetota bacterium]
FAVGRLVHAVTSRSMRSINIALGGIMVVAAPLTLLGPVRIYDDLVRPSLVALWLSQLIVFAVYPRFAARNGHGKFSTWSLTVVAIAFTLYGLWTSAFQLT